MGGVLAGGVPKKSRLRPSAFDRNARTSVLDVAPGPFELPAAILGIGLLPRRVWRAGREDREGFGRGLWAVVRHELPPKVGRTFRPSMEESITGRPPEQCDEGHMSVDSAPVESARSLMSSSLPGRTPERPRAGNVDSVTAVTATAHAAWECPHSRWSTHRGVSWQIAIRGKRQRASRRFSPQS